MASYVRHRDGWRAHVYVKGARDSRTFRTRRAAEAWAVRRERELAGSGAGTITFSEAAERWLAWKLPQLENDVNVRTVEQSIREHVLPDIGTKRLGDLKRKDLIEVVMKLADAGKVETAHRVGQRINAILDHAIDHGDIESHVGSGLSRVLPKRKPEPMAAVRADELSPLLQAIDGYPEPVTRLGLLLLAHTFTRTSELIGARWEEIRDTDTWVIPEERMKRRLPHVVPLSSHTQGVARAVARDDRRESVYPRLAVQRPGLDQQQHAAVRNLSPRIQTPHDRARLPRSRLHTVLNECGLWHRDAIERQLSHRGLGIGNCRGADTDDSGCLIYGTAFGTIPFVQIRTDGSRIALAQISCRRRPGR